MWHPGKYAQLLSERLIQHNARVWLMNTGWSGGAYGEGSRINLSHTRAILRAIHSGELASAPTKIEPHFGLSMVTECPEVPSSILVPRDTWKSPTAYDEMAAHLAGLFQANFKTYEEGVNQAVVEAGPNLSASAATH